MIDRLQTVTPLLGEEIVYGFAKNSGNRRNDPDYSRGSPIRKASRIGSCVEQPEHGNESRLFPYSLTDTLLTLSSPGALQWLLDNQGKAHRLRSPMKSQRGIGRSRMAAWH